MGEKLACKWAGVTVGLLALVVLTADSASARNREECERFARDYSRREARRGGGVLRGAARGGIRAGIVGDIFGDNNFAEDAAKVGATIGAISGGSRRARNRSELYDLAFEDCMRGATVTPY